MVKEIRVYQWGSKQHPRNFGDLISKKLVEKITAARPIVVDTKTAELLAVGSILTEFDKRYPEAKVIWGSGFIEYGDVYQTVEPTIAAVRGKLTAERLNFHGAMGDPGLLVSKYFRKGKYQSGRIGIVPHFFDKNNPMLTKFLSDDRYKIIDVEQEPEVVIEQITTCDIVYSSSMHGLIVADSFNLPNFYIEFESKTYGNDFKFQDYYSIFDNRNFEDAKCDSFFLESYEKSLGRKEKWVGIDNLECVQEALIMALLNNMAAVLVDSEMSTDERITDVNNLEIIKYDFDKIKIFTQFKPFRQYKAYAHFKEEMTTRGFQEIYQNPEYTLFKRKNITNKLLTLRLRFIEFKDEYGVRVARKIRSVLERKC